MRFIIDENAGPRLANWLTENGHDVISVYDEMPGIADEDILSIAVKEDRIVVTSDKDFGDLVFRNKLPHKGVILMRLVNESSANKLKVVQILLEQFTGQLSGKFVVLTEAGVRIY